MSRFRIASVLIGLALVSLLAVDCFAQGDDRAKLEKKIESLMNRVREKEKEFLSPSAEDRAAFAEFLRQPDTGIIRLLPREKYDGKLLVRGGGAYYSFARLVHEYGYGSDIELQREYFSVGFAGADYGFLVNLGNTPVESISVEHPGVKYLAEYTAPSKEPEAREQHRRGYPGFDVDGFTYASRTPALTNTTYAVRSISYEDSDVLIAFRVVRQDTDGSMILLWKILKKFPTPHLER
ncbi:MAG TPA: hypothetical protein VNN73_07525 [Blastocatellia bacterium]|nr:hypothetical protein [Blastocatellia bacterium]